MSKPRFYKLLIDSTKYIGHRGANGDYPGNTIEGFDHGLSMELDGLEMDIRESGDGVLVLANKPTTHMCIQESYRDTKELPEFKEQYEKAISEPNYNIRKTPFKTLRNCDLGNGTHIISFEEFLKKYGNKDIDFSIELKHKGISKKAIVLIKKYIKNLDRVTLTSFSYEILKEVRECDNNIRIGWLTDACTDREIEALREIGGIQLCPRILIEDLEFKDGKLIEALTPEKVKRAKERELEVRAWGAFNEELVNHAIYCGVDGLTLNFPTKYRKLLKRTKINNGRGNNKGVRIRGKELYIKDEER